MAAALNTTPEGVLRSPLTLIGTPEEMIGELKRRVDRWEVSQFLFSGGADRVMRQFAEQVMPHV
jgi:hypothetical protein